MSPTCSTSTSFKKSKTSFADPYTPSLESSFAMLPYVNTTGYSGQVAGFGYPGERGLMSQYGYPGERGLMQQYSGQPYTQSAAAYGDGSTNVDARTLATGSNPTPLPMEVALGSMILGALVRGALGYYVGSTMVPSGEHSGTFKWGTAALFAIVGDGIIFPAAVAGVVHFAHK